MSQSPQKSAVKNNLLSNVSPPSELPSFFAAAVPPPQPVVIEAPTIPQPNVTVATSITPVVDPVSLDSSTQNITPVPMYAVGSASVAEQIAVVSFLNSNWLLIVRMNIFNSRSMIINKIFILRFKYMPNIYCLNVQIRIYSYF